MQGPFEQILDFLISTVFGIYIVLVLLRLIFGLVRADFYNPISQFLVKVTNPLVLPLRRVLPSVGGIDTASLVLALLLQLLGLATLLIVNGIGLPNPGLLLLWSVLGVIGLLINIYFFALLAMIILSWIAPGSNHPAIYLLYQITEPVMAPFRRLLPPMGGLDLSPILVFILINVIQIALRHAAVGVGLHPALVIGI